MRFIAFFVLFFATSVFAAEPDREMKEIINSFYNTYLTVRPSGVPSVKEQQKFKPYVSATLAKVLQDADRAERQYQKKTKGESPPFVEGDLFTSLFEGATKFKVLSCDSGAGACLVEFSYIEPGEKAKPVIWKDKVFLVKETRGWLVDDIEFLGDWQFMHKGRLKELLKEVIKEVNDF
jgi:hypothetical protein